jgi:hypothetical protein
MLNLANTKFKEMLFQSEQRWLYQMSAIGFILGAFSFACLLLQQAGLFFAPDLKLHKPSSICTAFGIFLATTALVMPLTGLSYRTRSRFQHLLCVAVYYGYAVEMIQVFRGVDPRFGKGNFYINILPGIVDGLLFAGVIVMYVWLMLQFFTAHSYRINPLMVLGIRYGLLASMVGFGTGIWMSVEQSRYFGNIMSVHFLGFHGLQAAPILALLLARCTISKANRHGWLHAAGLLWLVLSVYSILPTSLGRSLFNWSDPWVTPLYALLALWVSLSVKIMTMLIRNKSKSVDGRDLRFD